MNTELLELFQDMRRMVETAVGKPASLTVNEPTTLIDGDGRYERLGAIWFLQTSSRTDSDNNGFYLDVYGQTHVRVEAWGRRYRATAHLYGEGCQDTMSVGHILCTLLPAALRPPTELDISPEKSNVLQPDPVPDEPTWRDEHPCH